MSLVKADGPLSRGPCADQQWARRLAREESEQRSADSPALMCRPHVCVAYQSNVANMLNSHDADQSAGLIPAPEGDPRVDLSPESRRGYVRFVPAIRRNNPSVGLCRLVDHRFYGREIAIDTAPNHLGVRDDRRRIRWGEPFLGGGAGHIFATYGLDLGAPDVGGDPSGSHQGSRSFAEPPGRGEHERCTQSRWTQTGAGACATVVREGSLPMQERNGRGGQRIEEARRQGPATGPHGSEAQADNGEQQDFVR